MSSEKHFEFGANWTRFLKLVDESRISAAAKSLQSMLGRESLQGQRFLDAGCGSGLFSLAAHRLGAEVLSFDIDPLSVKCAEELRRRFGRPQHGWKIEQGSALDSEYLHQLGLFDVVYSWGVLHHTGSMWQAIELVAERVAPGGVFWLAIYNDQGQTSGRWKQVKQLYQRLPRFLRPVLTGLIGLGMVGQRLWSTFVSACVRICLLRNPLVPLMELYRDVSRRSERGMDRWIDLEDWVGGWPFEVARPEEIFRFLRDRGFQLMELKTCGGGLGCNEFVLQRVGTGQPVTQPTGMRWSESGEM